MDDVHPASKGFHTSPKPTLQFEFTSHESLLQNENIPPRGEHDINGQDYNEYLMSPDSFVKGKRLIDPVTGRVEGDEGSNEKSDDSFEMLEKKSLQSKRSKSDVDMMSDSDNRSSSQMSFQIQNLDTSHHIQTDQESN